MIRLGFNSVSIYPDDGIKIENYGKIIFNGKTLIGNHSFVSVGKSGILSLGKNFISTAGLKLACYHRINIENDVLIGWENVICDTDFHATWIDGCKSKGYAPVEIGQGSWLAMGVTCLKGTKIPEKSVVGARSLLVRDYSEESKQCVFIGDNPAKIIRNGIFRNPDDDRIDYRE